MHEWMRVHVLKYFIRLAVNIHKKTISLAGDNICYTFKPYISSNER